MEKSCGKGLSGFALKYIAMVSMLCDHANFLVIRRGVFAPYTAADGSILIPADAPAGFCWRKGCTEFLRFWDTSAFPSLSFC